MTVVVAVAVAFESTVSRLESCIVKSKVDHISSISAVQRSNITLQIVKKTNSQINVIVSQHLSAEQISYLPPRPILRRAKPIHLGIGLLMLVSANLYFLSAIPPSLLSHQGQFPKPPDTGCAKRKV